MSNQQKFYIGGKWVEPVESYYLDVENPATEEPFARIAMGTAADVDRAVAAAKAAFVSFSITTVAQRLAWLRAIHDGYQRRYDEIAQILTREMGAPLWFTRERMAERGPAHLAKTIEALEGFVFERAAGRTMLAREPIGVCGMITPWNWPLNQIICKVAPALAAGCTMVLKPSEVAPLDAVIFAEIVHESGLPAGVFNLVNGDGATVGGALSAHPDVDMISFTGSTRAGIAVGTAAAKTIKRVALELGGKSPNILLDDADFDFAVERGVIGCFMNSGQSCSAPTRMLVPKERLQEVKAIARRAAEAFTVGDPTQDSNKLGPVVSKIQFEKVQALIESGIVEGAMLVAGGPGRPEHLNRGYYVRPTVFADVTPDMRIAREEIFGPVLTILSYSSVEEAIEIANDTVYGLAAYVSSKDLDGARKVARKLRAGNVHINYAPVDIAAPFGGYKQSGNGREYAQFGMEEFLETKAVLGYEPA